MPTAELAKPLTSLQTIVWIFDPAEGRVRYCSEAFETIWGRPLAELIANPGSWLETVLPCDRVRVEAEFAASQRTGLLDTEFRIKTPERGVRWIRVRACPAPWITDHLEVLGISDDVTDRKTIEADLQERAAHLRTALEAGRLSGWRIDLATNTISSTAYEGVMPIEEMWQRTIPPEDIDTHRRNVAHIAESNGSFEYEHRQVRPGDGYRQCVSRGQTVRDAFGRATAIVGATMDITSLTEQKAQLAEALAEKEMLVREVHHRVKNSLQTVSTFLLLQQMAVRDPFIRNLFASAADRVHSVGRLHDLLCRGGVAGSIDLAEYLGVLVEEFLQANLEPGLSIARQCQGGIDIDADQGSALGIAVNELLTNALKYGRDADGRCKVKLTAQRRDGNIAVTIADSGRGLDRRRRKGGAAGIGLVVVETMAKHLHGVLMVGRRPGARFSLVFPAGATPRPSAIGLG